MIFYNMSSPFVNTPLPYQGVKSIEFPFSIFVLSKKSILWF